MLFSGPLNESIFYLIGKVHDGIYCPDKHWRELERQRRMSMFPQVAKTGCGVEDSTKLKYKIDSSILNSVNIVHRDADNVEKKMQEAKK